MEKDEEDVDSKSPIEKARAATKAKKDLQTAVIAVASGGGIAKLLKSLGVTHIITGSQTMNPSTQDILDAINNSGAKQAIVLPNNGNIFMIADQAAEVADISTKTVHDRTIARAMSALLEHNPEASLDENQANVETNTSTVASGAVTNAVRGTAIDDRKIKKDDYMGIVDGRTVTTDLELKEAAIKIVKAMLDEDNEIVTISYGTGGDQKAAEEIKAVVEKVDDELDIQIYNGDQPVYPYLISVE